MNETARELPRYKCHKEVWAVKIKELNLMIKGALIVTEEEGYESFPITQGYIDKHKPASGGYYVVYEDGYTSYSPAEAFEAGYSLIS